MGGKRRVPRLLEGKGPSVVNNSQGRINHDSIPLRTPQTQHATNILTRTQHRQLQRLQEPTPTQPSPPLSPQQQPIQTRSTEASEARLDEAPLAFLSKTRALQALTLHTDDYPLPNSSQWTAGGDWSNLQIDDITQQWQATERNVYVLHAMFLLDAQQHPLRAQSQLQHAEKEVGREGKIHMVCWIRHHWIGATFWHERMEISDSAPGIATITDLRTIAEFVGEALQRRFIIIEKRVPRQPKNSTECGSHCVANIMMNHKGWIADKEQSDKNPTVVSYAHLTELFTLFANGEIRKSLLGDSLYHLLKHEHILKIADIWPNEPMKVRWMAEDGMKTWTGTLKKRHGKYWSIQYDEMTTLGFLPHGNVCYLTIEPTHDYNPETWTADLMALNIRPPPSSAKVEGDTTTVKKLKEILNLPRQTEPYDPYFTTATAQTTRASHIQVLNILKTLPDAMNNMTITQAIPSFINTMKGKRDWMASTTLSKLSTAHGVLKALPYYIVDAPTIIMQSSTIWKTALRGATIEANLETPNQALPLTSQHLYQSLTTATPEMSACLEIAWPTAGRIRDILLLPPKHVSTAAEGVVMVKFTDGKVAKNGSYTIAVPPISANTAKYLQDHRNNFKLFPTLTTTAVKEELRKINIRYECRSIRRGRLQELSLGGMSDTSLLHISRHADVSTLRRYLDFGLASGENLHRARQAAKASILAARQTQRQLTSSSLTEEQDALPGRTLRGRSPPWLHGDDLSSQSDPSWSESAIGE